MKSSKIQIIQKLLLFISYIALPALYSSKPLTFKGRYLIMLGDGSMGLALQVLEGILIGLFLSIIIVYMNKHFSKVLSPLCILCGIVIIVAPWVQYSFLGFIMGLSTNVWVLCVYCCFMVIALKKVVLSIKKEQAKEEEI